MSRAKVIYLLDQPEAALVLIPLGSEKRRVGLVSTVPFSKDWAKVNKAIRARQGHEDTGSIGLTAPDF